jgi:hypothetical protein
VKLAKAILLGHHCGLESDVECVNNVLFHATMLFPFNRLKHETQELITDARVAGISFCLNCGFAMLEGKCAMTPCYMCERTRMIGKQITDVIGE